MNWKLIKKYINYGETIMLPAYNMKKSNPQDKYYQIGYKSYFNSIPRDLADDLVLTDRASYLLGWDTAKQECLNKSPRTPRPSVSQ